MYGNHFRKLWIAGCLVALIGGIVFTETHHKLPFFRLLTFSQVFVGAALVTSLCRGKLQSAMLVTTTFVFGLVLIEGAGNWVIARRGAVETARDRVPVTAASSSEAANASAAPNRSDKDDVMRPAAPPDFKAKIVPSTAASSPSSAPSAPLSRAPLPATNQTMVDANLFSQTPGVGWRLARAGDFHVVKTDPATGQTIYDVHYTIDGNLDRKTVSADGGRPIVFLGDSFTFGSGVDDSQTMAQRLADLLERKQRIVNLGVPGYSPAQVLYQLKNGTKANVIGPKPAALIMLTGPYHASRIACKDTFTNPAPRFARDGSTITYEGPCYAGISRMWREFLDNSASYRAFVAPVTRSVDQADLDLYVDLVAEVSATAKKLYGVRLLVPFVHFSEASHDVVLAKLRAKDVDVIDMTLESNPDKAVTIRGDGHPTAYAHDLRARMIKDALESRGVPMAKMADTP